MAFQATAIGELLRRNYPKAQAIIQQALEAIQLHRTQAIKLNEIDIINKLVPIKSKVKVYDEEYGSKMDIHLGYPTYYPATEPDGDKVKVYLHIDHYDSQYDDYSGFANNAFFKYNGPVLPDNNIATDFPDLGNGMASRCQKIDGISSNRQVYVIPDVAALRQSGSAVGFSFHMRIRFDSIGLDTTEQRSPVGKADDASNAWRLAVDANGALLFHFKRAGVVTKIKSTNGTIVVGTIYEVIVTVNYTGPVITIYIYNTLTKAGAAYTTADVTTTMTFNTADFSMFVGGWGSLGTTKGYVNGEIQHFVYSIEIWTATDVGKLKDNLWTKNNSVPNGGKIALTFFTLGTTP
jgi:hypothetical protein